MRGGFWRYCWGIPDAWGISFGMDKNFIGDVKTFCRVDSVNGTRICLGGGGCFASDLWGLNYLYHSSALPYMSDIL